MKVSRAWLQNYFDKPLPDAEALADALTFHAFEIEEHDADMIDVKVLPNRAADCLCHRGIACELSAILDTPIKADPLRMPLSEFPRSSVLEVTIESEKCNRYIGTVVRGVKVGPSPEWLRNALESVGQRSINNVVDATNYVMLNIGQPLHAFDLSKLTTNDQRPTTISVRNAEEGEVITTLDNRELKLDPSIMVIADGISGAALGIAGIKGGKAAEVDTNTTDIVVESANFDGVAVRRAAQKLKLFTDASLRFQNKPSPELPAYGMRDVLALIVEIAGGEIEGVADMYPNPRQSQDVTVSLAQINGVLGTTYARGEVENVFKRLGLDVHTTVDVFTIMPPFERTDLVLAEDLIEEVGRLLGYDRIAPTLLPPAQSAPDQATYRGIERAKDLLVEQGFVEVSTQSFAKKGDVYLANPLDKTKPALRNTLTENMKEALAQAKQYALRLLPPGQKPQLFEVGTIFTKDGEKIAIETSTGSATISIEPDNSYEPKHVVLGAFKQFSAYPFMTRDIALWAPGQELRIENKELSTRESVEQVIRQEAGSLLVRLDLFDTFEKEGRVSYAFRLVFESMERTLTDEEVNAIMEKIYTALRERGFEIR
ncbi:MAG TPA: phenylalanine--tRNA ligase subunit beta [Candidatus Paceibacterota bacterium]